MDLLPRRFPPPPSTPSAVEAPPPPLSPWKLFAWGTLLGILLTLVLFWASPSFRRWQALEDAKIQVEVRKILEGCPPR